MRKFLILSIVTVFVGSGSVFAIKSPPAGKVGSALSKVWKGTKAGTRWAWKRAPQALGKTLANRAVQVYLVGSLVALPLLSETVLDSRDTSRIADRLLQERISTAESNKLVIYPDDKGSMRLGVLSSSWLRSDNVDALVVKPLEVSVLPSVFDGLLASEGWWQMLNDDFYFDFFEGRLTDRNVVTEVSINSDADVAGERVRILTAEGILSGRAVVALNKIGSEELIYAVRIDEEAVLEGGVYVEQNIEPYFKFLSAEEFGAAQ